MNDVAKRLQVPVETWWGYERDGTLPRRYDEYPCNQPKAPGRGGMPMPLPGRPYLSSEGYWIICHPSDARMVRRMIKDDVARRKADALDAAASAGRNADRLYRRVGPFTLDELLGYRSSNAERRAIPPALEDAGFVRKEASQGSSTVDIWYKPGVAPGRG